MSSSSSSAGKVFLRRLVILGSWLTLLTGLALATGAPAAWAGAASIWLEPISGAELNTRYVSGNGVVSGLEEGEEGIVRVLSGNSGGFWVEGHNRMTSGGSTVVNGDIVRVMVQTGDSYRTDYETVLSFGNENSGFAQVVFRVTTRGESDYVPPPPPPPPGN